MLNNPLRAHGAQVVNDRGPLDEEDHHQRDKANDNRYRRSYPRHAPQLTRLSRALPRAGQHVAKRDGPKALPKLQGFVLAARGQRNVRPTGVLAGQRPLGFAVSNEKKALDHLLSVDDPYFTSVERIARSSRRRFEVGFG